MYTETKWWHVEDNTIACDLCPRECKLHEGQRGFCFVRQNVDNKMTLTTYGKSTGFCVDPIEKKPLNHFLPGTSVLSFGTAGCNLGCKFCQNWSISKAKEIELLSETASPQSIAKAALDLGCRSVAFTYNDPVIWAEYAIDTAMACHELGLKTVAVTAGYITEQARPDFYRHIDAANVDLKAFTETFYKYLTFSRLAPVLETLKWLKHHSDVWFEITNLVIPGENDSPDELKKMCDWIVENLGTDVPLHFSAFHPDFRMRDTPPTPIETLIAAHDIATNAGILYVYTGNVHDRNRQSTYCPGCGQMVIERDWYEIGDYHLSGNQCERCGTTIAGVFDGGPGNWGRRRVPVRIPNETSRNQQCQTGGEVISIKVEPKVDFSEQQVKIIADHTRRVVEAAIQRTTPPPPLPEDLADSPTFGVFVTAKRGPHLRACRGRWGQPLPLEEVLTKAAADAVLHDPRFPSIGPEELPYLDLQVSLMYDPRPVDQRGFERAQAVEVGRHGVVLTHPSGRGLLLPQVAAEHGWDAVTFLQQLSRKAGLPRDGWLDEETSLMTFQARLVDSPAPQREWGDGLFDEPLQSQLLSVLCQLTAGHPVDQKLPSLLVQPMAQQTGLFFQTASGKTGFAVGRERSLYELAEIAVNSAKLDRGEHLTEACLLGTPIHLSPADYPQRLQTVANSAVFARNSDAWCVVLPRKGTHPCDRALTTMRSSPAEWIRTDSPDLTAFCVMPLPVSADSTSLVTEEIRPAARAGQFYPEDPQVLSADVAEYIALGKGPAAACRAILLPHAGWRFCGSVLGKTVARVLVPSVAIIIGPKHTPFGPNLSISSASHWQLPGMRVPIAQELRQKLLDRFPGFHCESQAHSMEHGSEVLLPFLRHRNPELEVVPIVLGPCDFEETTQLAEAIREVVEECEVPPLLVISSDMNHFADDWENRRRDRLALEALRSGDPRQLYDTCQTNRISMCGLLPAVTVMQVLQTKLPGTDIEVVDYATSADVTGDRQRVVGYAGAVIR